MPESKTFYFSVLDIYKLTKHQAPSAGHNGTSLDLVLWSVLASGRRWLGVLCTRVYTRIVLCCVCGRIVVGSPLQGPSTVKWAMLLAVDYPLLFSHTHKTTHSVYTHTYTKHSTTCDPKLIHSKVLSQERSHMPLMWLAR